MIQEQTWNDVVTCRLTIHKDRGTPMVSREVSQLLGKLRIKNSHGRPHVFNDIPYSESQFKSLKYHPTLPDRLLDFYVVHDFTRIISAWFDHDVLNKGIDLVTPSVVH